MKIRKINIIIAGAVVVVAGSFAVTSISSAATLIQVPFTSQAPFGNWAQPWQDFCEEASVVMAAHFVWGMPITPKFAETEMQIIKQYEEIAFKRHKDTSIQETAAILSNLFGFKNIRVRSITMASDIKEELDHGGIVIAPVAGRLLKNPYFTPPGPLYHMLVIRGFNDTNNTFITNDPGTRRGNGFAYNQESLLAAIHDWNGGDVMRGEKNVIIIKK
ncbi:MAG: C39 family peptidase [Patescibacteria group bacterium]